MCIVVERSQSVWDRKRDFGDHQQVAHLWIYSFLFSTSGIFAASFYIHLSVSSFANVLFESFESFCSLDES
jgi:hypothetical protein